MRAGALVSFLFQLHPKLCLYNLDITSNASHAVFLRVRCWCSPAGKDTMAAQRLSLMAAFSWNTAVYRCLSTSRSDPSSCHCRPPRDSTTILPTPWGRSDAGSLGCMGTPFTAARFCAGVVPAAAANCDDILCFVDGTASEDFVLPGTDCPPACGVACPKCWPSVCLLFCTMPLPLVLGMLSELLNFGIGLAVLASCTDVFAGELCVHCAGDADESSGGCVSASRKPLMLPVNDCMALGPGSSGQSCENSQMPNL